MLPFFNQEKHLTCVVMMPMCGTIERHPSPVHATAISSLGKIPTSPDDLAEAIQDLNSVSIIQSNTETPRSV